MMRCTLVSLQVEKEHLQIFRIINNSLHRCQKGRTGHAGLAQPAEYSVTQTAPLTSILVGVGFPEAVCPATGFSVISALEISELY